MQPKTPAPSKMEEKRPQTPQERREELKENIIAITIVLVLSAFAAFWVYTRLTTPAVVVDASRAVIPISSSPMIGNQSAPVTVILFSDFECPYCGEFARVEYPVIKRDMIDTGKVRFVYKYFPLQAHPDALPAANAAACAHEQNKFWEYHDLLYAHQENLGKNDLLGYASMAGLDTGKFSSCFAASSYEPEIMNDKLQGERNGVAGTPTFYFNGRKVVGAMSAAQFEKEVAAELVAK